MQKKFKTSLSAQTVLILCFLIPLTIMALYAAYRNMAPFGNSSILTVDLGQQYIDLFSYFRQTILHHPSSIFYSFSNGLGNEMIGTWAYYLMSPLNFLLLFFSNANLPEGILLLILLKIGLSGFTFGFLIEKLNLTNSTAITASFSTAYALNGWMVANCFNVIWLDAMILLPLIILGLTRVIFSRKKALFICSFTSMLIISYYMAYMITIFTLGAAVVLIVIYWKSRKTLVHQVEDMAASLLLSGLLSAFILLPTLFSLLNSKIKGGTTHIVPKFEYFLPNVITKFVPGAFNFGQMPKGLPNLFVTSAILLLFLLFFINHSFSLKARITVGLFSIFLLLSTCFEPLDLFWHGFQAPVWYPHRFSFVICFWLILIGLISLKKISFLNWKQKDLWVLVLLIFGGIGYTFYEKNSISYLNNDTLIIGAALMLISMIILLSHLSEESYFYLILGLLIIAEITINLYFSLNTISYLSNSEYQIYVNNFTKISKNLTGINHRSLYRIGKDFGRTKDDPFNADYNGASLFSSVTNPNMSKYMGSIGEPNASGELDYTNGSLVTDSLLGMKYQISRRAPQTKDLPLNPDQSNYRFIKETKQFKLYQNPESLPLVFSGSRRSLTITADTLDPIQNQADVFAGLTGNSSLSKRLFKPRNFSNVTFQNVQHDNAITGTEFKKQNANRPASLTFTFTPTNNDSYYLTLGPNLDESNCQIKINGKTVPLPEESDATQFIGITTKASGQKTQIDFKLKKSSIWMQNVTLYELNNQLFKQKDAELRQSTSSVEQPRANQVNAVVNIKPDQLITTTIPESRGWHATIDGKPVKIEKWDDYFIALRATPGKHHLVLTYWPPYLTIGMLISFTTLLGISGFEIRKHFRE